MLDDGLDAAEVHDQLPAGATSPPCAPRWPVHGRAGRRRRRDRRSTPSSGSSPTSGPTGAGSPSCAAPARRWRRDGVLVEWLRWVLLILTGSLDRPGGMRFQHGPLGRLRPPRRWPPARPPCRTGEPTRAGRGRRTGAGGGAGRRDRGRPRPGARRHRRQPDRRRSPSPIGCGPRWPRSRCSPSSTSWKASSTELATHVLPATGQLERADLTLAANLSVRSGVQATPPRSSLPVASAGRCGGCSASWRAAWAASLLGRRRSRRPHRRAVPPRPAGPLAPRRRRRVRRRATRARRRPGARLGPRDDAARRPLAAGARRPARPARGPRGTAARRARRSHRGARSRGATRSATPARHRGRGPVASRRRRRRGAWSTATGPSWRRRTASMTATVVTDAAAAARGVVGDPQPASPASRAGSPAPSPTSTR